MNERAGHRSLGVVCAAAALTVAAAGAAQAGSGEPPVVGGGSGIIVDNQAQCTLTTVGYDRSGRLLGLTAGHCGDAGAKVVTEANPNFGVVGRFVYSNPNLDYALIEFTPGRINPVARVGDTTITGIGAPAQFPAVVCKKGRTTGTSCGVVWGNLRAAHHETWTQMCVLEGDSGAPVLAGSTLVGMVNAYLGVGCLGPEVGTNMAAISADLDARDETGAGFHPIP
ncbi:S1 family peptidase [Nocardia sp. NPDC051832]|uniref:S1 family peptidase n=1 Tax=Nocardia sp. NPDC051832 TaxID=3155673 RepID=UPI00343BA7F2